MAPQPPVPRIVKPRTTGFVHFPVLVIDLERDVALTENGEILDVETACLRLPSMPSSMVVTPDAARLLAHLDGIYAAAPRWQFRVTPLKNQVIKSNGEMSSWKVGQTLVNFFGWQRVNGKGKNHYHYPVDPFLFCRATIADLLPPSLDDGADRPLRLLQWGQDLRAWCELQNIKVSPTSGGLAAQLLRDPRWFPAERRKVPKSTNARVRPKLPGNFYHLYADVDTPYDAYYLDMKASHHTIAASIDFPHPDHLTARGYFDVSDASGVTVSEGRPWLRRGTRGYGRILNDAHGLLYLKLHVPVLKDEQFPLPYLRNRGPRMAWVYTNEVPTLIRLGVTIEWITAAWVSFQVDPGLNRYAAFALRELDAASEDRKRWLKPSLLAAYGLLAARPRESETAYKRAEKGQERMYPAGSSLLRAQAMIRPGEQESPLVNVMYRGLIEAEQRRRALDLARYLCEHGLRVLAIYADSVFVESGPALPLLPNGWRVEAHLDALFFSSATHFTSRQLTKLPGVAKESSERVQIVAGMRGELHVGADLSRKGLLGHPSRWTHKPS